MNSIAVPVETDITQGNNEQLYPSELSLFETPNLHSTIAEESSIDYRPINPTLDVGGSLDFLVAPSVSQFVSLADTRLYLTLSLVTKDDKIVEPTGDKFATVINFIGGTLFDSVQLFLNGVLVSTSGGQYSAYKAYIEVLLDRSRFEKDTILQSGLYFKETALGQINDFTEIEDTGYSKRWIVTSANREFDVCAPIFTDLAQQSRLILSNVEIGLKMRPASHAFCINTSDPAGGFKLIIKKAILRVRKKRPHAAITLAISRALELKPAIYPHLKTEIRMFLVSKGVYSFNFENLFEGNIPSVLVLGLVDAKATAGDYHSNPFNFEHGGLETLELFVDDRPFADSRMDLKFDPVSHLKSSVLDGYLSLFKRWSEDEAQNPAAFCDITQGEYCTGYALYCFRFNSASNGSDLPLINRGNLRISAKFPQSLFKNMSLIIYAKFASFLTIDQSRNIGY